MIDRDGRFYGDVISCIYNDDKNVHAVSVSLLSSGGCVSLYVLCVYTLETCMYSRTLAVPQL